MWLIEVHWTQTASCHVLIGLARYSTASEGFCLISREIIYSTSNLLPVVKCHCAFTRPVFFMAQLWTSPRSQQPGSAVPCSSFWVPSSWASCCPSSTSLTAQSPHPAIPATENSGSMFRLGKELSCTEPSWSRSCCPRPGLQLSSSVSFGPLSAQLLIINNTVYLYQNHYLNWLHDTCCSPNCTLGKMCYKICDFVLCNYPSMGYKALLWCLK